MKKLITALLLVSMLCSFAPALAQEEVSYTSLYSSELGTLNYLITTTTAEFAVAANVIDTLVEYDRYGQAQPSQAESWEVSDDGLTWTFHLRRGSKWVNAAGEEYAEVVANDFVAAAKYILDAQNASSSADILCSVIEGAQAYYDGTSTPAEGEEPAPKAEWDSVGIKALDDYTLEYKLSFPAPYFLSMTTYVCFLPVNEQFLTEKGEGFGLATGNDTLLFNGAYVLAEFKPQELRVFKKNAANWDAGNVYIDTIRSLYNKQAAELSPELYQRGEIDYADINAAIAAEWLKSPVTADLIRPVRQSFYSYFYAFNFDPKFDAAFGPDNWKLAVNNENFRQSLAKGLDRVKAMLVYESANPESIMFNAVTPPDFVTLDGIDYINIGDLEPITALGTATFNEQEALAFRDKAREELTAAGVTFPIQMPMFYNPSNTSWAEECQIVEQQLEGLLGADYIDILVEAGPSSGFLNATRRAGVYAFMKVNWGPDYADPETFTDPFAVGATYNFPEFATQADEEGKNLYEVYAALVADAKAIVDDLEARYAAFAKAEAYLINHAFVVPFGHGSGGYVASRLNPFESQFSPFGLSSERYKGQHLLDKPMSTDQYFEEYDKWLEERAKLAEAN